MRHRKDEIKLSRNLGHRKALLRNLCKSLFISESITTTKAKAKAAQRLAERLISLAKKNTLWHRRQVYRILCDHKLVKRLFDKIAPRFKDIEGGYTRIFNVGFRKGDGAQLVILELTKKEIKKKGKPAEKKKEIEKPKEVKEQEPKALKKQPKPTFREFIKRVFKRERDSL